MTAAREFAIGDRDFLLDGQPFRILSGALHYFRIHPGHWADRIRKARQMGLNTVETYVAWNAHAPRAAEFRLDGGLDLGKFLDLIAEEGMHAIIRPGPYICGEWTNGGLPTWLYRDRVPSDGAPGDRAPSQDRGAGIRRRDPAYLAAVRRYLEQLAPVIVPRQVDQGGPILLVQVENEYGAYGSDKGYLADLAAMLRDVGVTVPLTTVDQASDEMLGNGTLPGLLATGSFGSDVAQRLAVLRRHQPAGPLMCAEFWNGWFDDWGGHHHVTPAAQAAAHLDELLSAGASVNIYMFHGGTNFGLTSGANDKGTYQPITTSYDYDAPLNEAGNPTAKYWAFRDVIARHAAVAEDRPHAATPAPELTVVLGQSLPLRAVADRLGQWTSHDEVVTMDEIGQYQGLAIYQASIDLPYPSVLTVGEVRDRAQVFLNGQPVGILARDHHERSLPLPAAPAAGTARSGAVGSGAVDSAAVGSTAARARLEILVEDQGRVDYGPRLGEPKGLIGPVAVNGDPVRGWRVLPLTLGDIAPVADALRAAPAETVTALPGPAFARAVFDLTASGPGAFDLAAADPGRPSDLYLSTAGLGKGIAWLNGFCLGRYWSRGPQRTLYVPGPVTREVGNELIILELQAAATATVTFVTGPDLGHTEH